MVFADATFDAAYEVVKNAIDYESYDFLTKYLYPTADIIAALEGLLYLTARSDMSNPFEDLPCEEYIRYIANLRAIKMLHEEGLQRDDLPPIPEHKYYKDWLKTYNENKTHVE